MVDNFDMYKNDIAKIQVLYSLDLNGANIAKNWLNIQKVCAELVYLVVLAKKRDVSKFQCLSLCCEGN